jgi:hypothetical protein
VPTILKDIDIFLFDFHWDVRPLFFPERLKPEFAFLSNPEAYNQKQKAGTSFAAGGLELHPLTARVRRRNRFWSRYGAGELSFTKQDWNCQTPFTVHPNVAVAFNTPGGTGKVRSTIHVNSMGWSTTLELTISGNLDIDQLQTLSSSILNKKKIFTVASQQQHVNDLLNHCGKLWQSSVYKNPGESPQDTLLLPRHLVVSIARYQGASKPYRQRADATNWMTAAERAKLHSVLWGRPFTVFDLRDGDDQRYLYTQFGDSNNFALTYFDHGSLIFMQDEAAESASKKARRKSMTCMARNLSDFSRMVLSFDKVLNLPIDQPPLVELKGTLRHCLKSTGTSYTNHFCKTWFLKHNLLRQL